MLDHVLVQRLAQSDFMIVPASPPSTGFDRKVSISSYHKRMKPPASSCARSETGTINVGSCSRSETSTIRLYDRTGVPAEYGI